MGAPELVPALIARLQGAKPTVCVEPPLLANARVPASPIPVRLLFTPLDNPPASADSNILYELELLRPTPNTSEE